MYPHPLHQPAAQRNKIQNLSPDGTHRYGKGGGTAVFVHLSMPCEINTMNWNKKHRENLDKLRTGNIMDAADVYKYLRLREKKRSLSTGEKKLLINSKNAIFSEIMLATDYSEEALTEKIDEIFLLLEEKNSES